MPRTHCHCGKFRKKDGTCSSRNCRRASKRSREMASKQSHQDLPSTVSPVAVASGTGENDYALMHSLSFAPTRLDLGSDEWTDKLSGGQVFEKFATVNARASTPGEVITTTLADGTVETSNVAEEGDVIITNPGGESYIVKADKFRSRYQETSTEGVFQARGMVRAVKNDSGKSVVITAPWGEDMTGDKDCWIVEVADPADPSARSTDRYIIGGQEFNDTYRPH